MARLGKGDLSSGVEWFSRRRCVCGGGEEGNSVAAPCGLRDGLRQSGSAHGAWAGRLEPKGSGCLEAKGAAEAASRAEARDYQAVPLTMRGEGGDGWSVSIRVNG